MWTSAVSWPEGCSGSVDENIQGLQTKYTIPVHRNSDKRNSICLLLTLVGHL